MEKCLSGDAVFRPDSRGTFVSAKGTNAMLAVSPAFNVRLVSGVDDTAWPRHKAKGAW
jgi:hypothetical protein